MEENTNRGQCRPQDLLYNCQALFPRAPSIVTLAPNVRLSPSSASLLDTLLGYGLVETLGIIFCYNPWSHRNFHRRAGKNEMLS